MVDSDEALEMSAIEVEIGSRFRGNHRPEDEGLAEDVGLQVTRDVLSRRPLHVVEVAQIVVEARGAPPEGQHVGELAWLFAFERLIYFKAMRRVSQLFVRKILRGLHLRQLRERRSNASVHLGRNGFEAQRNRADIHLSGPVEARAHTGAGLNEVLLKRRRS